MAETFREAIRSEKRAQKSSSFPGKSENEFAQKFNTDDASLLRSGCLLLVEANFPHGKTNLEHYPVLDKWHVISEEFLRSFRAEISGDEVKWQLFFQTKQLQKPDLIL